MSTMHLNPSNEISQNLKRYYSHDPYVVLGLSRNANGDEIKKAWRGAQAKFHPDRNRDPRAVEISQNINVAYGILNGEGGNLGASPHAGRTGPAEKKREAPKDEVERRFHRALENEARTFAKWVSDAKAGGISSDRIQQFIKSAQAQKLIKDKFIVRVKLWGDEGSDYCLKYIGEWRAVGIEMGNYLEIPEVQNVLFGFAVNRKIKIFGDENPKKFLEFVDSWKKAGVDLSKAVELPEAKRYLELQTVGIKIKIWGEDSPDKFLSYVKEWKKAGVDLSGLVNSSEAQKSITFQANLKLKYRGKQAFKVYVEKWISAGWKPSQEITNALKTL